jgi:N-acetylmuramoyl-L-alanine amidase
MRFKACSGTNEESSIPRSEGEPVIIRVLTRAFALALGFLLCTPATAPAAQLPLAGETFVVDPGHGVRTPDGSPLNVGAVGPGGIGEATVVLAIGEKLAHLLRDAGATVVLTRSYAKPYRTGTVIRVDNRARAKLANELHATAFIALHADASLSPASHGTSVFWLKPNSVALANAVRAQLAPLGLGESAFHARDLAVTSEAVVPAVLVETGFITNPREEHLLVTPSFQEREARALFAAIVDVFGR